MEILVAFFFAFIILFFDDVSDVITDEEVIDGRFF